MRILGPCEIDLNVPQEPQIELDDFVECLHYQHQEVSQRTLMRMEGRIRSLENLILTLLEEHIVSPKVDGKQLGLRATKVLRSYIMHISIYLYSHIFCDILWRHEG